MVRLLYDKNINDSQYKKEIWLVRRGPTPWGFLYQAISYWPWYIFNPVNIPLTAHTYTSSHCTFTQEKQCLLFTCIFLTFYHQHINPLVSENTSLSTSTEGSRRINKISQLTKINSPLCDIIRDDAISIIIYHKIVKLLGNQSLKTYPLFLTLTFT